MRVAAFFLLVLALFLAGCEDRQYDNRVGKCSASNGRYEIVIETKRDSDKTDVDSLPPEFLEACRLVEEAR